MRVLYNNWIFIPLVASLTGFVVYIWADKWISFLHKQSLGQREDILKYLKLMGVEPDSKRITIQMLLLSFGLGAMFFILFWPNIYVGLLFGISITVAGWKLPFLIVKSMYESRCTRFTDQMVDALTIMSNGVKAGSNPQESMRRVIEIMQNPISSEFQQVVNQMQVGDSFEGALTDLAERIPRPDVQMFVTSINILKETGGNMAETFETIVYTIRERQKVEKKIQALTAQGLMQGLIVTLIPFLLCIVFFIVDPNFIKPMFTTTLGLVLLFVMLTLQIIGGIAIKKIVTIKV